MASLKEIRGRIGSIRNIAQITRAMEMMSASRMKRAQDAILAARPYSDELRAALSRVAGAVSEEHRISNDEYLFEPSPEAVIHQLLTHYVAIDLYRALLENNASEESARMVAMRSATDNANELIDDLTLVYNKTRQATITREMIEIASGAEALG